MTPWLCWKRCTKILLPCHCAVAILPCQKKQMPLIQLGVWNDKGYQPKLGICLNVLDQKPTWFHSIPPFATRSVIFQSCSHIFFSHFSISNHLIEASPQTLQVCQGQRRPWEKLPANLVRKPSTVSTLETKNLYRVLWWIYLFVTQNSLGKKNIWASTIKCPCSAGWFDKHLTKLTVIPIFNLPKPTTPTNPACIL